MPKTMIGNLEPVEIRKKRSVELYQAARHQYPKDNLELRMEQAKQFRENAAKEVREFFEKIG